MVAIRKVRRNIHPRNTKEITKNMAQFDQNRFDVIAYLEEIPLRSGSKVDS